MKFKLNTIIPILIIIICSVAAFYFQSQHYSQKVIDNNVETNCLPSLKSCGPGCIPQNAVCCDEINGNSYCLAPNTLCKANPKYGTENGESRFLCSEDGKEESRDCPTGQISCGMFCIKAGEKCCFGGICKEDAANIKENQIPELKAMPAITSATCKIDRVEKLSETCGETCSTTFISLDFKGTVIGPIGTTLQVEWSNCGVTTLVWPQLDFSCGSWSKQLGQHHDYLFTCLREEGQPETVSWSAKLSNYTLEENGMVPVLMVEARESGWAAGSESQLQQEVPCN